MDVQRVFVFLQNIFSRVLQVKKMALYGPYKALKNRKVLPLSFLPPFSLYWRQWQRRQSPLWPCLWWYSENDCTPCCISFVRKPLPARCISCLYAINPLRKWAARSPSFCRLPVYGSGQSPVCPQMHQNIDRVVDPSSPDEDLCYCMSSGCVSPASRNALQYTHAPQLRRKAACSGLRIEAGPLARTVCINSHHGRTSTA